MTIAFRPRRDAVLGVIAWVIPLLTNFVVTPVVVRGLGATDYGIYALLSGFGVYAVALAANRAIVRFSPLVADTPLAGCRRLLPTALGLAAASAVANCIVLVLLRHWLLRDVGEHETAGLIVTCALVAVLVLNQVLVVVPQIARRYPLVTVLTVISGVLLPLGALVVVNYGGNWMNVLLWQLVVATLVCVSLAASAAYLLPRGPAERLGWHWQLKMVSMAVSVGLAQMLGHGLALSERGVLGSLAGPDAVGHYVLAMTIALLLQGVIAQATAMLPVMITQAPSEKTNLAVVELYCRLMRHVLAFVTFGAIALVVCGPAFVSLWLKEAYSAEISDALRWLAPAIALLVVSGIPWVFAEARGFASANVLLAGFWLVGVLALASFLVPPFGAEGLAVARLATMIAVPVHILWVELRVFGAVQKRLWLGSFWRLGLAACASATVMHYGSTATSFGWTALAITVSVGFALFGILLFATKQIVLADLAVPESSQQ